MKKLFLTLGILAITWPVFAQQTVTKVDENTVQITTTSVKDETVSLDVLIARKETLTKRLQQVTTQIQSQIDVLSAAISDARAAGVKTRAETKPE